MKSPVQLTSDPFAQKYPDSTDSTLSSNAVSVRFNPSGPYAGHYLAAGGADGLVEIWDTDTQGIVRVLEGHVKAVGGLDWSRNNRYLVSASLDATCIVWDLASMPPLLAPTSPLANASSAGLRHRTLRFDAPVATAYFHPRNSKIVLATLTTNEVVLVDLRRGERYVLTDVEEEPEPETQPEAASEREERPEAAEGGEGAEAEEGAEDDEGTQANGMRKGSKKKKKKAANGAATEKKASSLTCATFSPCGSRIYAGTSDGVVLILDPVTRGVLSRIKVGQSGIRQVAFDPRGQSLILSSTDRSLRVLIVSPETGALAPIHRFQDQINRTNWNSIGFSKDDNSEYVMGGSSNKMGHNVFIWDKDSGVLVKVLEGPKEPLLDSDWHPTRPIIASVANSGDIHVWSTVAPDKWASFAAGFEELEENVDYDEREDEFDIEDESDLAAKQDRQEDTFVAVLARDEFPRRPELREPREPRGGREGTGTGTSTREGTGGAEDEDVQAALRHCAQVRVWADDDADEDTWDAFYLPLNLIDPIIEDGE